MVDPITSRVSTILKGWCRIRWISPHDIPALSQLYHTNTGWWFGTSILFSHILGIIIPIDVHIFQRGGPTTNQNRFPHDIPWSKTSPIGFPGRRWWTTCASTSAPPLKRWHRTMPVPGNWKKAWGSDHYDDSVASCWVNDGHTAHLCVYIHIYIYILIHAYLKKCNQLNMAML